jgi:hypothetical protein
VADGIRAVHNKVCEGHNRLCEGQNDIRAELDEMRDQLSKISSQLEEVLSRQSDRVGGGLQMVGLTVQHAGACQAQTQALVPLASPLLGLPSQPSQPLPEIGSSAVPQWPQPQSQPQPQPQPPSNSSQGGGGMDTAMSKFLGRLKDISTIPMLWEAYTVL